MSRWIETIQLRNGKFSLLTYHQRRVNEVLQQSAFSLREILQAQDFPTDGLLKVRISYSINDVSITQEPYQQKQIHSLRIVESDTIDYSQKWENRSEIEKLYRQKGEASDILIVKQNQVTDSSYANLLLWDGHRWITPTSFLLNGVMRQYLLDTGVIQEKKVSHKDLKSYSKVKLINAMVGMNGPEIDIEHIY
jgi:4-amino-4-deoxychorismate lyase